jgi:hypothetical protein
MAAKLPSAPPQGLVEAIAVEAAPVDDALADFLRQHDLLKYLPVFEAEDLSVSSVMAMDGSEIDGLDNPKGTFPTGARMKLKKALGLKNKSKTERENEEAERFRRGNLGSVTMKGGDNNINVTGGNTSNVNNNNVHNHINVDVSGGAANKAATGMRKACGFTTFYNQMLAVCDCDEPAELRAFIMDYLGMAAHIAHKIIAEEYYGLDQLWQNSANEVRELLQTCGIKHGSMKRHMDKLQNAGTSDQWRREFTERHILDWLETNEISVKVLKTDPTHSSWHIRRAVLSEGMFIYTTLGEGATSLEEVKGFSSEHGMVNKGVRYHEDGSFLFPKYQLRGRFRISSTAAYTSLGEQTSQHSKSRGAVVHGIDLQANPNHPNPIRIFATSRADLDWLKLAIDANKLYADKKLGGQSTEDEYATVPGFGGQLEGWWKGENIRGKNRPTYGRAEETGCAIM